MINEVTETMKVLINLKKLAFKVKNLLPMDLIINSDRRRIIQILYNLISNALKFTRFGSIKFKIFESSNYPGLIFF